MLGIEMILTVDTAFSASLFNRAFSIKKTGGLSFSLLFFLGIVSEDGAIVLELSMTLELNCI